MAPHLSARKSGSTLTLYSKFAKVSSGLLYAESVGTGYEGDTGYEGGLPIGSVNSDNATAEIDTNIVSVGASYNIEQFCKDVYNEGWKAAYSEITWNTALKPPSLTLPGSDYEKQSTTYSLTIGVSSTDTITCSIGSGANKLSRDATLTSSINGKTCTVKATFSGAAAAASSTVHTIDLTGFYEEAYLAGWNAAANKMGLKAGTANSNGQSVTYIVGPKKASTYSETGESENKYKYTASKDSYSAEKTDTYTYNTYSKAFDNKYIWYGTTSIKDSAIASIYNPQTLYRYSSETSVTKLTEASSHSYYASQLGTA